MVSVAGRANIMISQKLSVCMCVSVHLHSYSYEDKFMQERSVARLCEIARCNFQRPCN